MKNMHPVMSARQRGVSLIELMVALVIAALLGIGIAQIFGGTRLAFNTNVALARAQENSRFALDFLNRDLRMTGHLGARNEQGAPGGAPEDPFTNLFFNHMAVDTGGVNARRPSTAPWIYRLDLPFQAFEYQGTGLGSTVNLPAQPQLAAAGSEWQPTLPADLNALFTSSGAGNTGRALRQSDILVIRYLSAEFVTLVNGRDRADGYPISSATPFVAGTGAFTWSGDTFPNFVQPNGIYAFSNARAVSLFQAGAGAPVANGTDMTSIATGTLDWVTNRPVGEDGIHTENSADYGSLLPVHRYELAVYYVGMGADGSPALFRRRLADNGAALGPAEELAPGVESLQVVMGAITTYPRQADQPTTYATADVIDGCGFGGGPDACWRAVVNARVGLLMRSSQYGSQQEVSGRVYGVAETNITADVNDRLLRFVYETQVSFRNRSRG